MYMYEQVMSLFWRYTTTTDQLYRSISKASYEGYIEPGTQHIGYEPADLTANPPPPQNYRGWVYFFA